MSWVEAGFIFLIIWWLVLFMVLPWGARRVDPNDLVPGEDHGAPEKPRLAIKFTVTTAISLVLLGLVYGIMVSGIISFRP